jgi:RIO-like serine/threonine protein kinase
MWREVSATEMKEPILNSTAVALTRLMAMMEKEKVEAVVEERMGVPTHSEHDRHASLYTNIVNITVYRVPRISHIHPLSRSASASRTKICACVR